MLRALRVVTLESFLLLRRDRIFVPALFAALAISFFAVLAGDWSIEEFYKVLYDVGFFGFQVMGGLVALFWGIKSVSDSRQDGALEVQLALPISRPTWLLGKYFGLCLALVVLAVLALVFWQALMLITQFGPMRPQALTAFAAMVLGWLVLGALGMLLASFQRQAVATFSAVCLWITGLASTLVANTMTPDTPALLQRFVKGVARAWDLSQFNLVKFATKESLLGGAELGWRGAYGLLLISAMITGACLIFSRRDVVL